MMVVLDWERLAILLFKYEMDEPRFGRVDNYYPEITLEKFRKFLEEPHYGDCINLPAPCMRCYVEEIKHKAEWIVNNYR